MNPSDTSKAVSYSEKVFQRLLMAYPQAHREAYGAAMAQLFRDQCRDAWGESRGWGLTKLWLRVLPDVVGTSFLEHLESIKERKFMLNRIGALFRAAPSIKLLSVFVAVFSLVVITAAFIAFILPKTYGSEAILFYRHIQEIPMKPGTTESSAHADEDIVKTEVQLMQSDAVLNGVIEKLDLNEKWGGKFPGGAAIQNSEALKLLRKMIVLETAFRSPVIHVTVYSVEPDEAVRIATGLIQAYFVEHRKIHQAPLFSESAEHLKVQLAELEQQFSNYSGRSNAHTNYSGRSHVHTAELEEKISHVKLIQQPSSPFPNPNKSRIIRLGIFFGVVLGLIAGASVAGISFWRDQSSPPQIAS